MDPKFLKTESYCALAEWAMIDIKYPYKDVIKALKFFIKYRKEIDLYYD